MAEPVAELSGKTSNLPAYNSSSGPSKSAKKKSSGTMESRLDYAVSVSLKINLKVNMWEFQISKH